MFILFHSCDKNLELTNVFSFMCFLEIYSRASNFKTFSIHAFLSR